MVVVCTLSHETQLSLYPAKYAYNISQYVPLTSVELYHIILCKKFTWLSRKKCQDQFSQMLLFFPHCHIYFSDFRCVYCVIYFQLWEPVIQHSPPGWAEWNIQSSGYVWTVDGIALYTMSIYVKNICIYKNICVYTNIV